MLLFQLDNNIMNVYDYNKCNNSKRLYVDIQVYMNNFTSGNKIMRMDLLETLYQ